MILSVTIIKELGTGTPKAITLCSYRNAVSLRMSLLGGPGGGQSSRAPVLVWLSSKASSSEALTATLHYHGALSHGFLHPHSLQIHVGGLFSLAVTTSVPATCSRGLGSVCIRTACEGWSDLCDRKNWEWSQRFSRLRRLACQPCPGSFSSSSVLHMPSEIFLDADILFAFSSCLGYFVRLVTYVPSLFLDSSIGSF